MPITPPKCKTCGKAEWRHVCAGAVPAGPRSSNGRTPGFGLGNAGSNPDRGAKLAALKASADAASARIAAKPRKAKRVTEPKKPKAGRPKLHPDRKAYKAQKERDRRAKAKAKPAAVPE